MRKGRFIIGIICIALAAWLFLTGKTSDTPAPAIAIAALGIVMVATSRKR